MAAMEDGGILIVEENYLTGEGHRLALKAAGLSSIELAVPDVAERLAEQARPAVAVLDLHVDGSLEKGLSLTNALCRLGVAHIVIVTGCAESELDLDQLARKPAAVLRKPPPADALTAAVRGCLAAGRT